MEAIAARQQERLEKTRAEIAKVESVIRAIANAAQIATLRE
jgi:hypothetical protein